MDTVDALFSWVGRVKGEEEVVMAVFQLPPQGDRLWWGWTGEGDISHIWNKVINIDPEKRCLTNLLKLERWLTEPNEKLGRKYFLKIHVAPVYLLLEEVQNIVPG